MENKYFDAAALKAELDGYVLGQDEGTKRMSLAIALHLRRIEARKHNRSSCIRKNNAILIGPSGSGKTETFRVFQRLETEMGIPVIMRNAPDYIPNDSWKGEKPLVLLMVDLCKEAVALYSKLHHPPKSEEDFREVCQMASSGIVLLDEIDKMNIRPGSTDAFCRDYQSTLLKMVEGSEYLGGRVKHPICGNEDWHELKVDTTNVMFVFMGAFEGLKEITRSRLIKEKEKAECRKTKTDVNGIGFTATVQSVKHSVTWENENMPDSTDLTPNLEDLIDFGIMRELAGRIPIRISYKALSVANLVKILKEGKTSVYLEYREQLANMGHKLTIDNAAFKEIARICVEQKTGARGLNNIFYDLLSPVLYSLSGTSEPMECILRGRDIKNHRAPVLKKIRQKDWKKSKNQ